MTTTESDRYFEKEIIERDGMKGRICTVMDCRQWVPLKEMPRHYQMEHAR